MIPGWKVRRELSRLGQQLRAIPEALWEPRFFRRYDRAFPSQLTVTEGMAPPSDRLSIFLIYPHPDLADSTVQTCAGLARAGYAPLVVSNAALSAADRARLAAVSWRVVERPNLGHDFGGYRDGLRLLWHWNLNPDRLLILNDSVWCLHGGPDRLLQRLEAVDADVAGVILRQRGDERFLESYAYLMSGPVLAAPEFRAFWQGLRLSSNKYKVIRRGERGHSAALLAAGYRLAAAFDQEAFLAAMQGATDTELCTALRHLAQPDAALRAKAAALSKGAQTADWRRAAMELVARVLEKGQFYSSFPAATALFFDYPVLKRSGDLVAIGWRRAYLAAVDAGDIPPPDPVVLRELRARVLGDAGVLANRNGNG